MTRNLILQDFAEPQSDAEFSGTSYAPPAEIPVADEAAALEAYDTGYKCGWADCAAAEAEERRAISADLAKNLSTAELLYETARRDVIAALGPFFEDVAATLLPKMAAAALAPTVLAELGALAEGQTAQQVEILAAPSACAILEKLAEAEDLGGVRVRPEPAFADGQVSIRVGSEQRDLDMASAASRIAEAIESFSASASPSESYATTKGAA